MRVFFFCKGEWMREHELPLWNPRGQLAVQAQLGATGVVP